MNIASSFSIDADPHLIHLISVSNLTKNYLEECLKNQKKPCGAVLMILKESEAAFDKGNLLDFGFKQLRDSDIFPLVKALEADQYFTRISVQGNQLESLDIFEELVSKNPMISEINLAENRFEEKRLRKINETLQKNKKIKMMMDFSSINNFSGSGKNNSRQRSPEYIESNDQTIQLSPFMTDQKDSGMKQTYKRSENYVEKRLGFESPDKLIEDTQDFEQFQEVDIRPKVMAGLGRERSMRDSSKGEGCLTKMQVCASELTKYKQGLEGRNLNGPVPWKESRKQSPQQIKKSMVRNSLSPKDNQFKGSQNDKSLKMKETRAQGGGSRQSLKQGKAELKNSPSKILQNIFKASQVDPGNMRRKDSAAKKRQEDASCKSFIVPGQVTFESKKSNGKESMEKETNFRSFYTKEESSILSSKCVNKSSSKPNLLENNKASPRNALLNQSLSKWNSKKQTSPSPGHKSMVRNNTIGNSKDKSHGSSFFSSKTGSKQLSRMKWIVELQNILDSIRIEEESQSQRDKNLFFGLKNSQEEDSSLAEEKKVEKKKLMGFLMKNRSSFFDLSSEKKTTSEVGMTFTVEEILEGLEGFPKEKMDQDDLFELVSGLKKKKTSILVKEKGEEILQTPKKAKKTVENKGKSSLNDEFMLEADSAESGYVNLDSTGKWAIEKCGFYRDSNKKNPSQELVVISDSGNNKNDANLQTRTCSTNAETSSRFESRRKSNHQKTDSAAPHVKGFESVPSHPLVRAFESSKSQKEGLSIEQTSKMSPRGQRKCIGYQFSQKTFPTWQSEAVLSSEISDQNQPPLVLANDPELSGESFTETCKFQSPEKSKALKNNVSMTFGKNGKSELLRISFSKPFPIQEEETQKSNGQTDFADAMIDLEESLAASISKAKTFYSGGQQIKGFSFRQKSGMDIKKVEASFMSPLWIATRSEMVIMKLEGLPPFFFEGQKSLSRDTIFHERLQILNLAHCQITNLKCLFKFPHIVFLNLSENKLESLDGIEDLPYLQELVVRRNSVSNMEKIKSLKQLSLLDMRSNSLCDYYQLAPLLELKSLSTLLLKGNPVASFKDYFGKIKNALPQVQHLDQEKALKTSHFREFEEFCGLEEEEQRCRDASTTGPSSTSTPERKEDFKGIFTSKTQQKSTQNAFAPRNMREISPSFKGPFLPQKFISLEGNVQVKKKKISTNEHSAKGQGKGSPKKGTDCIQGPRRPGLIIQNIHINSLGIFPFSI